MMCSEIHVKQSQNGPIFYSLVQKESDSKVSYNWRLLVVLQQQYVGYISKPNMKQPQNFTLQDVKAMIPFKELAKMSARGNILLLANNQKVKWQFKMKNQAMCVAWQEMLQEQVSPGPSRSATKHNQRDEDISYLPEFHKEESPIKSQLKNEQPESQIHQNFKSAGGFDQQKDRDLIPDIEEGMNVAQTSEPVLQIQKVDPVAVEEEEEIDKQPPMNNQVNSEINLNFSDVGPSQIISEADKKNLDKAPIQASIQIEQKSVQIQQISFSQSEPKFQLLNVFHIPTPPLPQIQKEEREYHAHELTKIQSSIPKDKFVNFFRKEPQLIHETHYQLFLRYAEMQVIKLLNGDIHIPDLGSISKPNKSMLGKSAFSRNNFAEDCQETQKENPLVFHLHDIKIVIPLTQLKQVPVNEGGKGIHSKYTSHSICDESLLKEQLQELKNYDYIWECMMRDGEDIRDKFLIPVSCVIEYAGWVAIVQSKYSPQNFPNVNTKSSQIDSSELFDRLSEITRLSRDIFEDRNAIDFIPTPDGRFVLSSVKSYLPKIGQAGSSMRPQLFMKISKKTNKIYPHHCTLKEREAYSKSHKAELDLQTKKLVERLEKMESYFMHPCEISDAFHDEGINIKEIGAICQKVSINLTKSYLKSEIASRIVKLIFRKKMQEDLENIQKSSSWVKSHNPHKVLPERRAIKALLNLILSRSEDSKMLWKVLTLHSQIIYGASIQPEQLHKGYFLLGIQHQLGIQIKTKFPANTVFRKKEFIESLELVTKVKKAKERYVPITIKINESSKKANLFDVVAESEIPYEQYGESIIEYFGFSDVNTSKTSSSPSRIKVHSSRTQKQSKLPMYFTHTQKQLVMSYLANFIPPATPDKLNLYGKNVPLTVLSCRRQLTSTKWTVKRLLDNSQTQLQGSKAEYIFSVLEQLYQKLQAIHRSDEMEAYPFFSQIHDLISMYYLSTNKYHDAIHHGRLSLTNLLQVCGSNMHVKIANSYYQLSQCYIKSIGSVSLSSNVSSGEAQSSFQILPPAPVRPFNPLEEALNCLKKAKNILETNLMGKSSQYSLIEAQLGKICLLMNRDGESAKLLSNSLRIMQNSEDSDIADIAECYELLLRSFYNEFQEFTNTSQRLLLWLANSMSTNLNSESDLVKAQEFNEVLSDELLQKILKMVIQGEIVSMMQICYKQGSYILLSDYLIELSITEQIIPRAIALQSIRSMLQKGTFVEMTALYFQEFYVFLDRIHQDRLKLEKKRDLREFQRYFKDVSGALGEGYIGETMMNFVHLVGK